MRRPSRVRAVLTAIPAGAWMAVAVLAAMRLFFEWYPIYQIAGDNLAPAAGSESATPAVWRGTDRPGIGVSDGFVSGRVSLEACETIRPSIEFPIDAIAGYDAFRVRGCCRSDQLQPAEHRYMTGRVLLAFQDASGKSRWDWPHTAVTVKGTRGWRSFSTRIVHSRDAVSARLIVHNSALSGVFEAERIEVHPLRVNPWNRWVFAFWGAVWGIGAWRTLRRLNLARRAGGWAVLVAAAAIVVGMLAPQDVMAWAGKTARKLLTPSEHATPPPRAAASEESAHPPAAGKPRPAEAPVKPRLDIELRAAMAETLDVHRAGHVIFFALLTLASARCFDMRLAGGDRRRAWRTIGGLALYAIAAEQLQWLTLTRSVNWSDIVQNLIGIAIGLILAESARAILPIRPRPGGDRFVRAAGLS